MENAVLAAVRASERDADLAEIDGVMFGATAGVSDKHEKLKIIDELSRDNHANADPRVRKRHAPMRNHGPPRDHMAMTRLRKKAEAKFEERVRRLR